MNVEVIQAIGNDILVPLLVGAVVFAYFRSKQKSDKDKKDDDSGS